MREGKDKSIFVGGTMAGKFYAGISGGQRKMLLFELIYQRTKEQEDLLIVLDEPFAGYVYTWYIPSWTIIVESLLVYSLFFIS